MKFSPSLLISKLLVIAAILFGSFQPLAHATDGAAAVDAPALDNVEKVTKDLDTFCESNRADDLWLVSTRHLGCPSWDKSSDVDLRVEHYLGKEIEWVESSVDDFFASSDRGPSDQGQPTLIYMHGNQISRCEAIARARRLQDSVLGCSYIRPIRIVIWAWPSDKVHGFVHDARVKAARTNGEAYYFASFLSQFSPDATVNLVGYSFGSRIITGALHLLGGGELTGRTLPTTHSRPLHSFRVALMAPALHNYWLRPGACHEFALEQMDRLLIHYNSCDPALKRYRFIEKHGRPAALGFTGLYVEDDQGVWIEQRDACCYVGKSHAEINYTNSPTLMHEIHDVLFGDAAY